MDSGKNKILETKRKMIDLLSQLLDIKYFMMMSRLYVGVQMYK